MEPFVVGSAMNDGVGHRAQDPSIGGSGRIEVNVSGDAAHRAKLSAQYLEEGSSAVPTRSPSPPLNSQPDTERGKLRKSKDPEHDRQSDSEAHQRSVPVQFLGVLRHTVFLVGEPAV